MKLRGNDALVIAVLFTVLGVMVTDGVQVRAQVRAGGAPVQKVIVDTDIGDDIDDVFAVGVVLSSPELQVLGVMSAWGDTALRSRMLDRLLCETGREQIPVATGIAKTGPGAGAFSQKAWASQGIERPDHPHEDAVGFLLKQIGLNPGEITLIAIGPLTNVGAAIERDPATFRKLKRVVMMGGSVYRGYDGDHGFGTPRPASPEYNIAMDPGAAQKLFRSGVPIYMMPLDSTQISFDETKRLLLASVSTPLTDAIQLLTAEWTRTTRQQTPTMFDAVAAAYAVDPKACPTTPLRIVVDAAGSTRVEPGAPNAQVCLEPQQDALFKVVMPRLLQQRLAGLHVCTALSGR